MSSKFFTWGHKGDKKPSPYGVVPIPAECITIHGIGTKPTHKSRRKPLPLDLYQAPEATIDERNRADDSIALHDAAVQSATSLLAVINDCLKSPPLSAHFTSNQQQPAGLQPMYGRPRSRTAPSTPMVEAPAIAQMSPVELPGSMPVFKRSHASHQSMDTRALRSIMTSPAKGSPLGHSIERPHSSQQESSHKLPVYPRQCSDSFSRSFTSLQPPLDPVPRAKTSSPHRRSQCTRPGPFSISDDTLVATESDSSLPWIKPVMYNTPPRRQSKSQTELVQGGTSQSSNMPSIPPLPPNMTNENGPEHKAPLDVEGILMDQISTLRSAHDAHVQSLKETHEKEIASHRSYVSFLERRIATQAAAQQCVKQNLTIDTSHLPNKDPSVLSSEASATTSMQSFELTIETQKRASSEAAAEAQKLRRERDHHKDSSERNERRVSQLRGIVRKAKENETALKNAISGLEASLLAANNERLDVLEGFHEAYEQVRTLSKECDEYRNRLNHIDPCWKETAPGDRPSHNGSQSEESVQRNHSLRRDKVLQQLDEVRQTLSQRNIRIGELEQQLAGGQSVKEASEISPKTSMEAKLEHCQQQVATARADRDRYNSLLHTELRRQSRLAAQKTHTMIPQLETDTLAAMQERLKALKDTTNGSDDTTSGECESSTLEKELEHCFREIIMYKLDIEGYKKDLKSANAELGTLRSHNAQQKQASNEVPVPRGLSRRTTPTATTTGLIGTQEPSSGLGISMPPLPTTPQRTVGSATVSALLSTTPTPQDTLSPPHRPKTPLSVHKKLPKPPPQSRAPTPYLLYSPPRSEAQAQVQVQRQETMRSLSESIISSYAKRSTPEQKEQDTTSPPRGRSSDPPRMGKGVGEWEEAKAVRMAKFMPRTLRAGGKGVGS